MDFLLALGGSGSSGWKLDVSLCGQAGAQLAHPLNLGIQLEAEDHDDINAPKCSHESNDRAHGAVGV